MTAGLQAFRRSASATTLPGRRRGAAPRTEARPPFPSKPSARVLTPSSPPPAFDAAAAAFMLLRALELRDPATARHSVAVARYAQALAQRVGLSDDDQELAHNAALVHDVGKISFPDRVLRGDEALREDDWALIRRHPEEGAQLVAESELLRPAAVLVRSHHERPDGHGYPHGLRRAEIPVLARVISVADCFDAMTARDSYRSPLPPPIAVAELQVAAGRQLDGELVGAFVEMLTSGPPAGVRRRRFGVRGRTVEEVGQAPGAAALEPGAWPVLRPALTGESPRSSTSISSTR